MVESGTLSKIAERQSTRAWEWDAAKAIAARWEAAGSWEKQAPPLPVPTSLLVAGTSITDATTAFLARCKDRGIATATFRKYETFVKQHGFV